MTPEGRGAQAPLNAGHSVPQSKGARKDVLPGHRPQEALRWGNPRDAPPAGTASFSGEVLAGADGGTDATPQPQRRLASSPGTVDGTVGRDGVASGWGAGLEKLRCAVWQG